MKKLLFIFLLFALKSTAQSISLNVSKTLVAPDTAFKLVPNKLNMHVDHFTINYDTAYISCDLHFTNNFDSSIYVYKENISMFTIRVPFTLWSTAFNTDGSVNRTIINQIINPFKLTY